MYRRFFINGIPLGWPERLLAGVAGVLLLLLGLVFGAMLLSLAAIVGLVLAARIWWLRRKLLRQTPQTDQGVIEGEYRVLERHHGEQRWY